jgi:glycerophosphoryl diester phosphodiesterase
LKTDLRLVYLHGQSLDDRSLDELATFADGIGPSAKLIENNGQSIANNSLVRRAHERRLKVYPYTLGKDEAPTQRFFWTYDVDGLFSDFPDVAVRARAAGAP